MAVKRTRTSKTRQLDTPIFASAAMKDLWARVSVLAKRDEPVLIQGEPGTGKDLVVRALHQGSVLRCKKPLVRIDLAALSEGALEAEVYGDPQRPTAQFALIASAQGGTIHLDHVEATPPSAQAVLMALVSLSGYRPPGKQTVRRVDVRFLATATGDLKDQVKAGRFRPDLLERLGRDSLAVPALRERAADILPLARHFLAAGRARPRTMTRATETALLSYDWPGNVRELEATIDAAVALTPPDEAVDFITVPRESGSAAPDAPAGPLSFDQQVDVARRDIIQRALAATHNVVNEAARSLRMNPTTLRRWIRAYGLNTTRSVERASGEARVKRRVLLLHDEMEVLNAARRALAPAFDVLMTDAPEHALSLATREGADLILAEYFLGSHGSGLAFAKRLRESHCDSPVAILSTQPDRPSLVEAKAHGVVQDVIDQTSSLSGLPGRVAALLKKEG